MTTYVFDPSWQKERDRLGALESLSDHSSRRLLTALNVMPGWHCLEVGCGAGGIALWLADQVGSVGHVLATDLDTRFLDGHDRTNLKVLRHDIVTDPLDAAAFDLIHARAVLEHLPHRDDVLPRLLSALKPGGWLLIEDVDFGEPAATLLAQYITPLSIADATHRLLVAVAKLFAALGADPSYGRRLPAALATAGLVEVAAEVHTPVVPGGSEGWTRGTIEQLADRLVGSGLVSGPDIDLFLTATERPETFVRAAVDGQRVGAGTTGPSRASLTVAMPGCAPHGGVC